MINRINGWGSTWFTIFSQESNFRPFARIARDTPFVTRRLFESSMPPCITIQFFPGMVAPGASCRSLSVIGNCDALKRSLSPCVKSENRARLFCRPTNAHEAKAKSRVTTKSVFVVNRNRSTWFIGCAGSSRTEFLVWAWWSLGGRFCVNQLIARKRDLSSTGSKTNTAATIESAL